MTPHAAIFWFLAALTVGSAGVVVFSRSLIRSAFALLFTFVGVAGLYLHMGADFLAAAQLLVYVGGILVLLVFGVMLTHRIQHLDLRSGTTQMAPAAIIAGGLFVVLTILAHRTKWAMAETEVVLQGTTHRIGEAFLGRWILPFWAASLVLLVAMIGAAFIVRRRKDA
jgi:NADH:ubiquinone oxidoreductase subunit 6 (subunit J)